MGSCPEGMYPTAQGCVDTIIDPNTCPPGMIATTQGCVDNLGGGYRGGGKPTSRGRGRKMPGGGRTCGGMNQPPCPTGGYRRGGKPTPRGRGRQMARGGRAPARRFREGGHPAIPGSAICPVGTFRTADGKCTKMGL